MEAKRLWIFTTGGTTHSGASACCARILWGIAAIGEGTSSSFFPLLEFPISNTSPFTKNSTLLEASGACFPMRFLRRGYCTDSKARHIVHALGCWIVSVTTRSPTGKLRTMAGDSPVIGGTTF